MMFQPRPSTLFLEIFRAFKGGKPGTEANVTLLHEHTDTLLDKLSVPRKSGQKVVYTRHCMFTYAVCSCPTTEFDSIM